MGLVEGIDFFLGSKIHKVGHNILYPENIFIDLKSFKVRVEDIIEIENDIILNKQELINSYANAIGERKEILHREKVKYSRRNLGIYSVENGIVVGEYGAVYTSNFNLIEDSILFSEYHLHKYEQLLNNRIQKPIEINGTVAVTSSIFGGINYYHWILNELPRFLLLIKYNNNPDYYISKYEGRKFQKEVLDILNIDINKLITIEKNLSLTAKKVIFPTFLNDEIVSPYGLFDIPKWAVEIIRESIFSKIENVNPNTPFVYISRSKAPSRRVLNEEEIMTIIEPLGFKGVCLEDLSFKQQVNLFRNAKVVIAAHGAGLTNLVFSNKGIKVYEVYHMGWIKNCFQVLCNAVGGDYYYSIGIEEKLQNSCSSDKDSNITFDLNLLKQFLKQIKLWNHK